MENREQKFKQRGEMPKIDIFWNGIEEKVKNFFAEKIDEKVVERMGYTPQEIEEKRRDAALREQTFVKELLSEVQDARKENPEGDMLILFDIDDTIGRPKENRETGKIDGTILRPSILELLRHIREQYPNTRFGIISTRGLLQEQLQDEKWLAPLKEFVDPNEVHSTKEWGEKLFRDFAEEENIEKQKELSRRLKSWERGPGSSPHKIADYLRQHPEVEEAKIPEELSRWYPGDYLKMEIIKTKREANQDTTLIAVDDFEYPKFLKHGVCVYPDAMFYF